MIDSSRAYQRLKAQIQDSIDLVVLCCHAVPALKGYMKAVEKGSAEKIPDPDLIGSPVDHQRLREIAKGYKKMLGRFIILSSFSYFEAYVSEVMQEVLEFHGGEDKFVELAERKRDEGLGYADPNIERLVKMLRERPKKGKRDKYARLNLELNRTNYSFPSDMFSVYGISHLRERLRDLRAAQVPDMIQYVLGLRMSDTEIETFHRIRDLRNDIAHGMVSEVDLRAAIGDNKFLRSLAVNIDSRVVKHFFVVEL